MKNSSTANVYSNAFNFSSFINSGVDPRTGTYSFSLSVSKLMANVLSGPSISLALAFNSLQGANIGFGEGWSIPMPGYNRHSRKLSVSTGGSYVATLGAKAFVLADKKVRDVKLSRINDDLFIEHKSGVVDVLSNPGLGWDDWLLSKVYSPEGRAIVLEYGIVRGRRYLQTVRDEGQRLLFIDANASTGEIVSITLWPDSSENRLQFTLFIQNNRLTKITVSPDGGSVASWVFRYQTLGGVLLITELASPTGGVERVSYKNAAFKLPKGAPISALPAVQSYTVVPGANQPAMTRRYDYSLNNYLGFGSSAPWRNDGDNLYLANGAYTYSCSETLVQGSGSNERLLRHTHRVYNRFHLLLSEAVNQNGKVVSQHTEYHEVPGLSFERQPANFQFPKRNSTRYYATAKPEDVREEVTLTDFDDYGNLLKTTAPTGVVETFEYYPPGGMDGCPQDSFGGVRWLKCKTVKPAPNDSSAPVLVTRYRYLELPSASAERDRFLVLHNEALIVGEASDSPSLMISRSYDTNPASPFLGRMTRKVETMNEVATTFDYRYEQVAGALKTSMGVLGESAASRVLWQDVQTGHEVKTRGVSGSVVETTHDRLGRMVLESAASGTANEARKSYAYEFSKGTGSPSTMSSVDAMGALTLTHLDGLGREVKREVQDIDHPDKPLRLVYNATYDERGQQISEIHTDWLDEKPVSLTTTYQYDDWGQRIATIGPDGVIHHDLTDPVSLTHIQWREGGGKTVSRKNVFGKDDSVERFDRSGQSLGVIRYRYDGLGRCIQKTDALGQVTRFSYDAADRLVSTSLPDGTRIRKEYVAHSTEDLSTQVWVNDYLAGERTYDALLRIASVTVGGRTERFTYEGAALRPSMHITASGKTIAYTYNPELNNQVANRTVNGNANLSASFHYHNVTAKLLQASSPGNQQQRTYSRSGKLEGETTVEGDALFQARQHHSLLGLPLSYVDAAGQEKLTRYDAAGRVSEVTQGTLKAGFAYDLLSQVSHTTLLDTVTGKSFVTDFEYDDFGKEIRRTLTVNGGAPEELLQQFDGNDKLIRRTLKLLDKVLRDETFEYDSRGRLQQYRCAGTFLPVDAGGKSLVSQRYEFDALDNITQLVSVFPEGENTATYYYENPDRTQLTRVAHSHPHYADQSAQFTYDPDGRQLNDERGRQYLYDELGRLTSIKGAQ